MGLGPQQRRVDDGRGPERAGGVLQRLVERLPRGEPAHAGILGRVLGGRRPAAERRAQSLEQGLQVGAAVAVQRRQDTVELDGPGGLGGGQDVPRGDDGRGRRPRVQVDVEVALQEQPRADVGGGVGVDGQSAGLDGHRRHRGARVAAEAPQRGDGAHVDPGDPDRRAEVQLGLDGEGGLEHERRGDERQRSAEHQEADHQDHHRGDQPGGEIADAGAVASHLPLALVDSVWSPRLPGGLPMTALPLMNCSLPAEHSAVCPGASVFGYGLTCSGPEVALAGPV